MQYLLFYSIFQFDGQHVPISLFCPTNNACVRWAGYAWSTPSLTCWTTKR